MSAFLCSDKRKQEKRAFDHGEGQELKGKQLFSEGAGGNDKVMAQQNSKEGAGAERLCVLSLLLHPFWTPPLGPAMSSFAEA